MKPKGRRKRELILQTGDKITLKIRRLKCNQCKKIHHELPDNVVPYKRHCLPTIDSIITAKDDIACCEESTISRINAWWSNLQQYQKRVKASLKEKYGIGFSSAKKLPEIVRALVNSHLWPGTRSALTPQ
jgi:ribosomal protein S13